MRPNPHRPARQVTAGAGPHAGACSPVPRDGDGCSDHTTIRGLSTEVAVDAANGLAGPSVVSCDNVTTMLADASGKQVGVLLDHQEQMLSNAVSAAFDLD